MTSRQRLIHVLEGKPTDRVPVSTYELVGYNSRAFENQEPSYRHLMNIIREKTDCMVMWNPSGNEKNPAASACNTEIEKNITREGNRETVKLRLHTPKGNLTATTVRMDNVKTTWRPEHWCKTPEDVDAMLSLPYEPVTYDFSDLPRVQTELGDRGIIMSSLSDPAYIALDMMEFGDSLVWCMTETEHFAAVVDEIGRRTMTNLKNMLESGVVDLYRICGPEYVTPPYLPRPYFERFVYPWLTKMTDLIHSYGGKVRVHCHGRIGTVCDLFTACGAESTDPCEAPPDGDITLAELKKKIGKDITLFGNTELKLLENGTTDQVRAQVKSCMDAAKNGGRFVLMPTAAPINIPLSPKTEENYIAFIEAGLEYGQY